MAPVPFPGGHWHLPELDLYEAECLATSGRSGEAARRIEDVRNRFPGTDPMTQSLARE